MVTYFDQPYFKKISGIYLQVFRLTPLAFFCIAYRQCTFLHLPSKVKSVVFEYPERLHILVSDGH